MSSAQDVKKGWHRLSQTGLNISRKSDLCGILARILMMRAKKRNELRLCDPSRIC